MRLHPRDERAARRAMGPSPSQSTPSRHDRPDGTKRPLLDEPEDGRRRVQRRASGEGSASCRRAPTPSVNGFEGRPARDWAGKAVRTAADPAQASIDECGTACGARTAGAPSAGESTSASRAWGKPRQHGLPREELGKPPDESLGFEKQVTGRRRFAPAQPATEQWPGWTSRRKRGRRTPPGVRGLPWGKDSCPLPTEGRAPVHLARTERLAGLARCAGSCERVARARTRSLDEVWLARDRRQRTAASSAGNNLVETREPMTCTT